MIKERIAALQKAMQEAGVDVYYITTSDDHMSEYIPEYYKVLRYFSGFTGSLGTLLVTLDSAHLFVDGRYHIQAQEETASNGIEVMRLGLPGVKDPLTFLKDFYASKTIAFDGKLTATSFAKALKAHGLKVKSIDLASPLMEERKPLSKDKIYALSDALTGKSRKEKLNDIFYCLSGRCHILANLESIAYVLNLRGNDIAYTPVFMAFLVFMDETAYLFVDLERLDEETLMALYNDGVVVKPYEEYYAFLATIKNKDILMDENKLNYESYRLVEKHNRLYHMRSIVEDMKAVKNQSEQENMKMAHIYDGVAMVRFLMWLKKADKSKLNEYDVVLKLNACRLDYRAFDLSFNPIVAYNANAAMMHYSPSPTKATKLDNSGILLVDSGGQYLEGTTDITRTIALGPTDKEIKKYFTLVLKSMFNLSEAVFKKGMSGCQIDILARETLWQMGIDYLCGTGHGVGYVSAVHEMPPNIRYHMTDSGSERVAFVPGHITSDEPGVYFEGRFGIRSENMLLCKEVYNNEYGQFLGFETLTLCPFDLELIDPESLDDKTLKALNAYHQKVYDTLSPYLNDEERAFLQESTRALS